VDTAGEGESGMNGESCINIYTLSCVRWMAFKLLCSTTSPVWHSVMTWKSGMGGAEGRDICIIMAISCCCMEETNTILQKLKNRKRKRNGLKT